MVDLLGAIGEGCRDDQPAEHRTGQRSFRRSIGRTPVAVSSSKDKPDRYLPAMDFLYAWWFRTRVFTRFIRSGYPCDQIEIRSNGSAIFARGKWWGDSQ
jgi:hypothetical protein